MALITRSAPPVGIRLPAFGLPRLSARAAAIALAGVLLMLTVDGMINAHAFFDVWAQQTVQHVDLPFLTAVLRPVDQLTSSTGAVAGWAALLLGFGLARWWLPALATLTLPAGGALNYAVGQLVGRTRPEGKHMLRTIGETDATSFPSGHVMGAVMLYGLLFVVADRIANRALRTGVKAASVAIIGIVGFGRIWYGAHWPSDVAGAYALGGLLLVALVSVYRRIDAAAGHLPFIHAGEVPHDEQSPHAHALTSLVLFNGATVSKVYAPGFVPRALYWLAFQAPFPYIANQHALRAAMHRRNMVRLLSAYWYGAPRVAKVTGIEQTGGNYALVSEFVAGHEPEDRAQAKAFLRDLRARFEEAGLPTWQIDPRQPRAIDNLLETADGAYHIVDLESGLVAPIASLKTWARALRRGLAPMFDDIFFDITRSYVAREEQQMQALLGAERFAELQAELAAAEAATESWHRSEPRLWSRLVRGLLSGFGIRTWRATVAARLEGSQEKAQAWIGQAIATWQAEGRIDETEAAQLREQMQTPAFQAMLPHLGAHLVISILLRFPFGSLARVGWSVGALGVATGRLLARRSDRRAWGLAWSLHSPLVILLSAIPGFGTFAYLAAKPIRQNRLLLRVTADAVLHKFPWRLYERSRLRRFIVRRASGERQEPVPVAPVAPEPLPTAPVRLPESGAPAPVLATVGPWRSRESGYAA